MSLDAAVKELAMWPSPLVGGTPDSVVAYVEQLSGALRRLVGGIAHYREVHGHAELRAHLEWPSVLEPLLHATPDDIVDAVLSAYVEQLPRRAPAEAREARDERMALAGLMRGWALRVEADHPDLAEELRELAERRIGAPSADSSTEDK